MPIPPPVRRRLALLPPLLLLLGAGCDRLRAVTGKGESSAGPAASDGASLQWRGDSALLAGSPTVLFRVVRTDGTVRAVPLARLGPEFGPLSLGNRGWRAFDVAYLYGGRRFTPLRAGIPLAPVTSARGMWEGDVLDSLPGCRQLIPGAQVAAPDGVELMVAGGGGTELLPAVTLSPAQQAEALQTLTTLVAPSAGVRMSALGAFRRTLHVLPTGRRGTPVLLALYNDPAPPADSTSVMVRTPRFLAVLMEPGLYGYRSSWQYVTGGTPGEAPRLRFLGYLDADGDGATELFFGVDDDRVPLHLLVLRREGDRWVELLRSARSRCLG